MLYLRSHIPPPPVTIPNIKNEIDIKYSLSLKVTGTKKRQYKQRPISDRAMTAPAMLQVKENPLETHRVQVHPLRLMSSSPFSERDKNNPARAKSNATIASDPMTNSMPFGLPEIP